MARPDPFLTLLKDIGFLPMRMPRADVKPLNMVEQDGKDLNLMGELTNAMISPAGVTAPPVISDIRAAQEIQGQKSFNVKFSIGITILGNILKAITGQDFGITAAFHNTATVTFEFADVTVDKVDIILLDQFLNQSDINPSLRQIHESLIEGHMGVITATAKTRKYLVSAQRDDGTQTAIDVPVIQQIAGGNVKVEAAAADNTKVSFEGNVPLAFGVQGISISFDENGHFTAFDPMKVGVGAVRGLRLAAVSQPKMLLTQAIFVDVVSKANAATA